MKRLLRCSRLWPAILLLGGLGCVSYRPAPVDLQSQAAALEGRSLADPGLKAYVEACSGHGEAPWPPARWDFARLTQAALYFSPAVGVGRAEVERARADAFAAGLRQDPSLTFSAQYQSNAAGGLSPWTAGPAFDVPLTTAGKRGIRQAQAAARLRESEFRFEGTCYHVRSALRSALVAWQFARRRAESAGHLAQARQEALAALDLRLKAGEASRPDVETARAEAEAALVALAAAHRDGAVAHAALAGALGVPEAALGGILIEPLPDALPPLPDGAAAEAGALTGRSDVLASLAAYGASDQALRLAVAEQYPDLHLQPGYLWDQGAVRWELGLSLILPLLNRNRGAIAQAEAERVTAGRRVLAVQSAVLSDVEQALAACGASREAAERALAQVHARQAALDATTAAVKAGEEDRLALALTRAGLEAARLEEASAGQDLQAAWGRLEDALERPLAPDAPLPPLPVAAPPTEKETP